MTKRYIIIFYLLVLINFLAQSQNIPNLPSIIPPSPNAQTFLKYGDFPVSNYTGVPDINIPIYMISLKDLSLPINLSYNSSGIRVNEEAGRVGLGWILNSGGLISHSIRETNDFYSYNYLNNPGDNDLPDLRGINPTDHTIQHNYAFIIHHPDAGSPHGPNPLLAYYRAIQNPYEKTKVPFSLPADMGYDKFISGVSSLVYNLPDLGYDFEPDFFNYNFSGYSGKFILLRNGKILKEKEDNLKIEYTLNSITSTTDAISWKITTPDGTRYYFNETEKVKFPSRPRMENYNSSFYLTKIETVNGTIISFTYKKNNTYSTSFSNLQGTQTWGQPFQTSAGYYESVILDSIKFPGGNIHLDYTFDREDIASEPKLKTIFINDAFGATRQKYDLLYSYFIANVQGVDIPTLDHLNLSSNSSHYYINGTERVPFTKAWNEKRLKLVGIRHYGSDGKWDMHRFEYNEDKLPTKLSSSIDHWGYFNGEANTSLIPAVIQEESISKGIPTFNMSGFEANREANANFNRAFILEKIKYPTGGETNFVFEANKFHMDNFENDPYKRNFMYSRENNVLTETQEKGLNNIPHTLKNLTVLNSSKRFNILLDCVLDSYLYTGDPSLEISIKRSIDDPSPLYKKVLSASNFLPIPPVAENKKVTYYSEDIWLPPGNYILFVGGSLFKQLKSITANAKGITGYPDDYIKKNYLGTGGGLRIKMINNYDSVGRWVLGKSFKYTTDYFRYDYYSPGFSSGKLMFYPRYIKNQFSITSEGMRGDGFSVGYSKVYVTDIDPNSGRTNGVSLYQYINNPDRNLYYKFKYGDASYAIDINPPGIDGFRYQENGTLVRDSLFTEDAQKLKLVKTTEYVNKVIENDIVWSINKSRFTLPSEPYLVPNGDVYIHENETEVTRLNFIYPALRPIWVRLDQKKETIFENDVPLERVTNYIYNPIYRNVIKEEHKSGVDLIKTVEYKYPQDVINNIIVNKLTSDNRINSPVEIKRTINGDTFEIRNEYSLFNNVPQLSSVKSNTGVNRAIEPRLYYRSYDKYGNPMEINKDLNSPVTYLWGYGGQYPVFEIKNATYAEVAAVLTQAAIDNLHLSTHSEATMETLITNAAAKLRNSLPQAMVSSYTYRPLVGMTSKTDARGVKETYKYDGMQRLQAILDQVGHVTKAIDYHYRSN